MCAAPDQCHTTATCIAANAVCTGGTNDGTACTNDGACTGGGACVGVCNNPMATDGTTCDDGDACNVGESCQTGLCTGGAAPDCTAAGDQCNTASCDPAGTEGNCDTVMPLTGNVPCTDGDPCTLPDVCTNGLCTSSSPACTGTAPVCQSLICDPVATGVCVGGTNPGVGCTNDTPCTGGGVCSVGVCSTTATTRCARDGDCPVGETCNLACTAQAVADGTACDDSAPCTDNDQCTGGACAGVSAPGCVPCSVSSDCDATNPDPTCHNSQCTGGVCAYPLNGLCPTLTLEPVAGPTTCYDPALTCTGGINAGTPCTDIFDCPGGTCDSGALDPNTNEVVVNVVMRGMDTVAGMNTCIGGASPGASCNSDLNCVAAAGTCDGTTCTSGVDAGQPCAINSQCHVRCNKIVSGQFYLDYDQSKLEFQSVSPTASFPDALLFAHDPIVGTIDYFAGVNLGDAGTSADGTSMAAITFKAIAACDPDAVVNFRTHSPPSGVADTAGMAVPGVVVENMTPVRIDGLAPDFGITCPIDRTVSADAGATSAVVAWPQPTAIDACDGTRAVSCVTEAGQCVTSLTACVTASDCPAVEACLPLSAPQPTAADGGTFPIGTTRVTCSATDVCGNGLDAGEPCVFNVTVVPASLLVVDVALDGTDGNMVRCITFELSNCSDLTQPVETVEAQMAFATTMPGVPPARVTGFPLSVPTGVYTCVTARDRLHSVRGRAMVTGNGVTFSASFDPATGGIALRGGDFNDDTFVDIVDFAILNSQFNTQVPANTNCLGLPASAPTPAQWNADLSGNGIVGIEDFSILSFNFAQLDVAPCCTMTAGVGGDGASGPIMRISVAELEAQGWHELTGADRNGDGWVDMLDVAAFAAGDVPSGDPPVAPSLKSFRHGRRKR